MVSFKLAFAASIAACKLLMSANAEMPKLDKGSFYYGFKNDSIQEWILSPQGKKFALMPEMEYGRDWSVGVSSDPIGDNDYTLKTTVGNKLQGIVKKLDVPVEHIPGQSTVIQYEVKFPKNMECGGGYIKVISDIPNDDSSNDNIENDFDDMRRVVYVFGPDDCFKNPKVYFMMMHENPTKPGTFIPKQDSNAPPAAKDGYDFNAYTLVITNDKHYKIKINGVEIYNSNYSTMEPPVILSKKIKDPNAIDPNKDYKAYIPDPEQSKPDDWDDTQPETINDPEDKMPDDWMVEEPLYIDEDNNELEEEWLEDILGEYVPRKVLNPKCENLKCGVWTPRKIANPKYKGPWTPQMIPNPTPPIEWEHPMIDNPNYIEDTKPEVHKTIVGVVFEIWATDMGVEFDNIYVGHSEEEADKILKETTLKRNVKPLDQSDVGKDSGSIFAGCESSSKVQCVILTAQHMLQKYANSPKDLVTDTVNLIKKKKNESPLSLIFSAIFAIATLGVYLVPGSREAPASATKSKSKNNEKSSNNGDAGSSSDDKVSETTKSPIKKKTQSPKDDKSDASSKKKKQ